MWTGMLRSDRTQWMEPDVIIRPGYTVPPTILAKKKNKKEKKGSVSMWQLLILTGTMQKKEKSNTSGCENFS